MLSLRDLEIAQQRHQEMRDYAAQQQPCAVASSTAYPPSLREKMGDLLIAAGEKLKAQPQVEGASVVAG